jgi:V/A-type H+-transporting ATPase subunit D
LLKGVSLQEATWSGQAIASPPAFDASPEAEVCRRAFAAIFETATPLAAIAGNLQRLAIEYRRSVRRARALQDVLFPELDRDIAEIENRLEEIEQEDATFTRSAADRDSVSP